MSFRNVSQAVEDQGFEVKMTKKGHWKFIPPDKTKAIVYAAGTPSDHRSLKNLIAQLRRSGLIWPWP